MTSHKLALFIHTLYVIIILINKNIYNVILLLFLYLYITAKKLTTLQATTIFDLFIYW